MKGQRLNEERRLFLSTIEGYLEDALEKVRNADNERYDSYDEYRQDYTRELLQKFTDARTAMLNLLELLDAID